MADAPRVTTYRPSLQEVLDGTDPSPAEEKLLAARKTGQEVRLGHKVPEANIPAVRIRGALIRYLLLGGCDIHRPHPKGVRIVGAWIDGALDFEACETGLDVALQLCHFPEKPIFRDARLGGLYLTGSQCPAGLDLHRLEAETNVHLRGGFHCTGLADLRGVRIGGQLACIGGRFDRAGGLALNCDAATVGADVFLRDGFAATGEVNLRRARIGGQLSCIGGRFDRGEGTALGCEAATVGADVFLFDDATGRPCHVTGRLDFRRCRVGGHLILRGARVDGDIVLDSARIEDALYIEKLKGATTEIDLSHARLGALRDRVEAWDSVESLKLTGLRYDSLERLGGVRARLDWLAKSETEPGTPGKEADPQHKDGYPTFDPQPYTQLAQTLDAAGQRRAAARVREAREDRLRDAEYHRIRATAETLAEADWAILTLPFRRAMGWVFKWLFGYGHAPIRALWASLGLVLLAGAFYGQVYRAGQMAPASDVILASPDWIAAVEHPAACPVTTDPAHAARLAQGCAMPLHLWSRDAPAATALDYESFSWWLYGLDLFIPLDALGQETAWTPSRERGAWGWWGFYLRWAFQFMGWIIAALGAAVLTGVVGRRE